MGAMSSEDCGAGVKLTAKTKQQGKKDEKIWTMETQSAAAQWHPNLML
jgi:hypothetical protein